MARRLVILAVVLHVSLAAGARAQEASLVAPSYPGLPVGERVRLDLGGTKVEGRLIPGDAGGMTVLQKNGATFRVESAWIRQIEVARRRSWLIGAGRGALIGSLTVAAIDGVLMAGTQENPDGTCTDAYGAPTICVTREQMASDIAVGAFVGAVIGSIWPGHRWERLQTDRIRVSVAPAPGGGVGVRTSVSF